MNNKFLDLFGEFIETEDGLLLKKVNEQVVNKIIEK
ncbi:hypothetical protein BACCIP111899_01616 [Bacillus rhizoplanae]|uniref:Uncharacterized protein n=1 Tax=Bacillus rhizoplanae TaxID=2880966 RepID=A0ABN7ZYR6_9BACI|nr:hypothetical protein BACCIP111899_01616 [Bacillus rhizoplanae]